MSRLRRRLCRGGDLVVMGLLVLMGRDQDLLLRGILGWGYHSRPFLSLFFYPLLFVSLLR